MQYLKRAERDDNTVAGDWIAVRHRPAIRMISVGNSSFDDGIRVNNESCYEECDSKGCEKEVGQDLPF